MFSGFLFDPVVSISNADFDGMRDVNGDFIRHDIGGDGADMWRAISNACHGIRGHGALAYLEEEQSWERFYSECFQVILLPHFAFIFQSSCAGNIKGIISADDKLLGQLPALAAQRLSLSASAVFWLEERGGAWACYVNFVINVRNVVLRQHSRFMQRCLVYRYCRR